MPILRFRHKGLERLFTHGDARGVSAVLVHRLRVVLARLNASREPRDMDLPGLRLHELKGSRVGTYAVRVNANWRLTFRFEDGEPTDVDLEDYH